MRKYSRQYAVPSEVVEYLLGRYCASTDPAEIEEGLEIVEKQLQGRTLRTGEEELFKARSRDQGSVRIIDIMRARLDTRSDSDAAVVPSLAFKDARSDDYLQRQAHRIEERHQILLSDAPGFLLPPDQNLEAMTAGELQTLCRRKRLRGWSKLRRVELLAFVKQELGPELEAMRILRGGQPEAPNGAEATGTASDADANRTERLLLLVLRHLGVPQEDVEAAWLGSQEPA